MAFTIAKRKQYAKIVLDELAGVKSDRDAFENRRKKNIDDWISGPDAIQREMIQVDNEFFVYTIYEISHIHNYIPENNGSQNLLGLSVVPTLGRLTMFQELDPWSIPTTYDLPIVNYLVPTYSNNGPFGNATRSNKYHNYSELFVDNEVMYKGEDPNGALPILTGLTADGNGELSFIKPDLNENFDGAIEQYGNTYRPINNVYKITKAIDDIFDGYIFGNTIISAGIEYKEAFGSGLGFSKCPDPFITITPGYRGNLPFNNINFSKVVRQATYTTTYNWWGGTWGNVYCHPQHSPGYSYVSSYVYWTNSVVYPTVLGELLQKNNKYTICGITDDSNNLIAWNICKIFGGTESSGITDHYKYITEYHYAYSYYGNGYSNWYYGYYYQYPVTRLVYDYSANSYNFNLTRVRCVTDGVPSQDGKVYPYVYFNNSLQTMCNIFEDLKKQYINCVEGIRTEYDKIDKSNYVMQDSVMEIIDSILKWKSVKIKTLSDIKWLKQQVDSLLPKFEKRALTLFDSMQKDGDYNKEFVQVMNNRLNKDDGTFWQWYRDCCTTDLLYTTWLKHKFKIGSVLKKMAVYEFAKDMEDPKIGSDYIYVKMINSLYEEAGIHPLIMVGDTVHILDDKHMETEAKIKYLSVVEIDLPSNGDDGNVNISEEGTIETQKIEVFLMELDRTIKDYSMGDNAVVVMDL